MGVDHEAIAAAARQTLSILHMEVHLLFVTAMEMLLFFLFNVLIYLSNHLLIQSLTTGFPQTH